MQRILRAEVRTLSKCVLSLDFSNLKRFSTLLLLQQYTKNLIVYVRPECEPPFHIIGPWKWTFLFLFSISVALQIKLAFCFQIIFWTYNSKDIYPIKRKIRRQHLKHHLVVQFKRSPSRIHKKYRALPYSHKWAKDASQYKSVYTRKYCSNLKYSCYCYISRLNIYVFSYMYRDIWSKLGIVC